MIFKCVLYNEKSSIILSSMKMNFKKLDVYIEIYYTHAANFLKHTIFAIAIMFQYVSLKDSIEHQKRSFPCKFL